MAMDPDGDLAEKAIFYRCREAFLRARCLLFGNYHLGTTHILLLKHYTKM